MIPMNIKATGDVVLSQELRNFVSEKLERVVKLIDPNDGTARVDIELASIPGGRSASFRAEFNISFKGGFVRAEAKKETLHSAIDAALEDARREVRKDKLRHRELVRRGAQKVKDLFRGFKNPFAE